MLTQGESEGKLMPFGAGGTVFSAFTKPVKIIAKLKQIIALFMSTTSFMIGLIFTITKGVE